MPIPFPGMNPYLEHPDLWPNVHQKMIAALADTLEQQLPAGYRVRLRERRYRVSGEDSLVVGSPGLDWGQYHASEASLDIACETTAHQPPERTISWSHSSPAVTQAPSQNLPETVGHAVKQPIAVLIPVPQKIYETYLEIATVSGEVVTIVEALSPKKKRPGRGRMLYERYREAIFGRDVHFVEIDLLRGWEPSSIYGPDEAGDYRILISRSEQRPRAQLYTWTVTEPIPQIVLPLLGHDELDFSLKPVVDLACDRTDLLVNYQLAPLPPLRQQENIWLEGFLQEVGMRPYAS